MLAEEALRRGAMALTLEVRFSNKAAQELYRRFGFAPVGVRKGYYQQPDEDALIMWVHDACNDQYRLLLDGHRRRLSSPLQVTMAHVVVSTEGTT